VPVAVIAVVAAIPVVPESKAPGDASYDIPGAVLVTLGLASLVYGFTKVAQASHENPQVNAWANATAWTFIVIGLVLVAAFVVTELRVRNPLLPMRLVLDRNRGGAYLTSTLVGAGLIGAFFFLSLYFQQVLGYAPVEAGFASLPTTLGVLVSAGAASALVPKVGPRPLMVLGALLAAAGLFLMSFLDVDTSFWALAFPGQLVLGLGLGFTFVPLSNLALIGAGEHDAGRPARCSTPPSRWAPPSGRPCWPPSRSARSPRRSPPRWPPARTRGTPPSAWPLRSTGTRPPSPGPRRCWWSARWSPGS